MVGVFDVEIFVFCIEEVAQLKQIVEQRYLTTVKSLSQHREVVVVGDYIEILRQLRLQCNCLCIFRLDACFSFVLVGCAV